MSFDKSPDQELLELCQKGCQKAYNALFERYFESLYRYIFKYLRNEVLAEELAMDIMLRLWQRINNLKTDINLPAYLFTSSKNALADHWRRKKLITIALTEEDSNITAPAADYDLVCKDTEMLYQQSKDTLSPQCREVFILGFEQGLTYRQIAQEMNISVNTVKTYMATARKRLRLNLQLHYNLIIAFLLICLSIFFR